MAQRRGVVAAQVRLTTRLTHALQQYVPQVLDWCKDTATRLCCAVLTRWPTLTHAQRARKTRLLAFCQAHHVRSPHMIEPRVQAILTATPWTVDHGGLVPNRLLAAVLVEPWRAVLHALERFDAESAQLASTLPDYPLLRALPGAGPARAPRLLAAFGAQRERYGSAAEIQRYVGIAPVTERSGNKCWVHWRLQCPTFLRQPFVEWAAPSIPHGSWAARSYPQQRSTGAAHQAALRALAFKWIRILYRCWQDRTPYDEATYLKALKRRGSPLLT